MPSLYFRMLHNNLYVYSSISVYIRYSYLGSFVVKHTVSDVTISVLYAHVEICSLITYSWWPLISGMQYEVAIYFYVLHCIYLHSFYYSLSSPDLPTTAGSLNGPVPLTVIAATITE